MDSIAVLIPCYNEARTVAKVVADYRAALPQAIRGTGGAGVTRDYAGMSSEEFRALEQQYRRVAQRGIRVRL